jgi:hypothetical protein
MTSKPQVILFEQDDGRAGIIYPAPTLDIHEVGKRSVRKDHAYVVVDQEDLPTDPVELDAMVPDLSEPDGYGENEYV